MANETLNTDDNTIMVKVSDGTPSVDYFSAENIIPGLLCEYEPNPNWYIPTHVRKHSTKQGSASRMFAVENIMRGKTIGYVSSINERIPILFGRTGDVVLLWAVVGESGEPDLVQGTRLISFGDGHLQPIWDPPVVPISVQAIVGLSLQDMTLSAVPQRVLVELN